MEQQEQLTIAQNRLDKDIQLKKDFQELIDGLKEYHDSISFSIQDHLLNLTKMEMEKANFIAHIFGLDSHVTFDSSDTNILKFDEDGHAETAIATDLDIWKDGSHMTLHRKG